MSADLQIKIEDVCPLLNVWQRWHWRKRRAYMEGLSWQMIRALRLAQYDRRQTPIEHCCIQIIRQQARGPLPDWDGVMASAKPLLDTLVVNSKRNPHGLGVIEDDNPAVVEALSVFPTIGPNRHTIIRIFHGDDRLEQYLRCHDGQVTSLVLERLGSMI